MSGLSLSILKDDGIFKLCYIQNILKYGEVWFLKKIMYLTALCLLLVGCSSTGEESKLTMDSFIKAFESEGIEVDSKEKPLYDLIGAKDGIIFYNDGNPVNIYEFENEKAISKAEEVLPVVKDWERNGLFVLETSHTPSKEIFKGVE